MYTVLCSNTPELLHNKIVSQCWWGSRMNERHVVLAKSKARVFNVALLSTIRVKRGEGQHAAIVWVGAGNSVAMTPPIGRFWADSTGSPSSTYKRKLVWWGWISKFFLDKLHPEKFPFSLPCTHANTWIVHTNTSNKHQQLSGWGGGGIKLQILQH